MKLMLKNEHKTPIIAMATVAKHNHKYEKQSPPPPFPARSPRTPALYCCPWKPQDGGLYAHNLTVQEPPIDEQGHAPQRVWWRNAKQTRNRIYRSRKLEFIIGVLPHEIVLLGQSRGFPAAVAVESGIAVAVSSFVVALPAVRTVHVAHISGLQAK